MSGDSRRILVVKLSSIGDVVQSLPVAGALRRRFPDGYIAWAVGPAAAEVVTGNPHLSEVLVVGGGGGDGTGVRSVPSLASPMRLRRALREIGFEVTLDLQGLFKSAALAYLSGAKERIGFRSLHEATFLLTNRRVVADRRDVHAVESYLDFAEVMGADREPVEFTIAVSEEDRQRVEELLEGRKRLVALIPGARWESKQWPTARFAAVADRLAEEAGLESAVIGGPTDEGLAGAIAASARSPILDLTGKTTLKQAAEVFRRCRVSVGNDTGPLYVSAAMGTPTVAVFGPTDARRLGPYGEGHAKMVARVECAPCRNRRCRRRTCMEAIEPEQVVEAALGLLGERQEA